MTESIKLKVGIIVVHYSNIINTNNCIKSIIDQEKIQTEIVLVNNSEDDLLIEISKLYPKILIIRCPNKGFSNANNLGLKHLKTRNIDIVWLLNNDAFPKANAGYELAIHNQKDISWIGGSILYSTSDYGKTQAIAGLWNIWKFNGDEKTQITGNENPNTTLLYPIGASLMINLFALKKINWHLDESYFLYFEELDLLCNLKKMGPIKISFSKESKVYHIGGASAGSGNNFEKKSTFASIHFKKSRRIFYKKQFKLLYFVLLGMEKIKSLIKIIFY